MSMLHPQATYAAIDAENARIIAPGAVTAHRREHDEHWAEHAETVIFDCGGVAVYSFVPETGRPSISLHALYVDYANDRYERESKHEEWVVVKRGRFDHRAARSDKALRKIAKEFVAAAQGLAERRLAGWQLLAAHGPWRPSLGMTGELRLIGNGVCMVHPVDRTSAGWMYSNKRYCSAINKLVKNLPAVPHDVSSRERIGVTLAAEVGARAEQAALVSALVATRDDLDGVGVAETAMALLAARQPQLSS